MTPGPFRTFAPDLTRWAAWSPHEAARRLDNVATPWYVAAGWALELFLGGSPHRAHEDLEIAVPRGGFEEVAAALGELEFFVPAAPGRVARLAGSPELLEASHQTWGRERATELWRLDVFREPHDGDTWICRRNDRIRMRYDELIERNADGIPFGRPEVVLLFKAKAARPKDDADLAAVIDALGTARRRRAAELLELVHPGHRWLSDLTVGI